MKFLFLFVASSTAFLRTSPFSRSSLSQPFNGLSLSDDPLDCNTCNTGYCAHCNDACLHSKEGACADCWVYNATLGTACLNSSTPLDCTYCWMETPCQLCFTGSCARCKACQQSRQGDCATCWQPDSNGFTCLSPYVKTADCKGCWTPSVNNTPIVVTSGMTASTLVGTWKDVPLCKDSLTPTQLWPFQSNLTLQDIMCYMKIMHLEFDETTKTFKSPPGVINITTVDFGGFDGMSFGTFFEGLLEMYGYRSGVDMFGVPFDWRLPAQGHAQLYANTKLLIENVVKSTGKKVLFLSPSYGPQISLGFLQQQTQQWKDDHIEWFVAASPVWSGSITASYALVSGFPLIPNASGPIQRLFRDFGVHVPGLVWLNPVPGEDNYTFSRRYPIVSTPAKNYSAYDLSELVGQVGYTGLEAEVEYLFQSGPLYKFEAPIVNTWVNYGYNVYTPDTLFYTTNLNAEKLPVFKNCSLASGDDIVSVPSSLRSMTWTEAHKQANKQLIHTGYNQMLHAGCLLPSVDPNHTQCFSELMSLLLNGTLPNPTPPPSF